jgi:hypothetical protein
MAKNEVWSVGGALVMFPQFMEWFTKFDRPVTDIFQEVYDTHPFLPWNGGKFQRVVPKWSLAESVRRILALQRLGLHFDYTFNNTLIDPKSLENPNKDLVWMLENTNKGAIGATVADLNLKDWFRSNFPHYRLTASSCFDDYDLKNIDMFLKEFDMVVVPIWANKQFDVLSTKDISKIKFIVDTECWTKCPYHTPKDHYDAVAMYNNSGVSYWKDDTTLYSCDVELNDLEIPIEENTCMWPEDMAIARQTGFRNFKIASRANTFLGLTKKVRDFIGYDNVFYESDNIERVTSKFRTGDKKLQDTVNITSIDELQLQRKM